MMQWVSDSQGRRLVCNGIDIDEAMEERYLKFYNGAANIDRPSFDVERFIDEELLKDRIDYDPEALDLPREVLGITQFNPDGSRLIRISVNLYRERESPAARGRFRFTCAHEAFHAIFHGPMFQKGGKSMCLERHIREDIVDPSQAPGDFTEWQANRGAAALLMPHSVFAESVKRLRAASRGVSSDLLAHALSSRFDVSLQSARIRLQTLGLMTAPGDDFEPEFNGVDSFKDPREREWR